MNNKTKFFFIGFFFLMIIGFSVNSHAENKINFSKKYYGFNFSSAYLYDFIGKIIDEDKETPDWEVEFPDHSLLLGPSAMISFDIGRRWAFRPVAGYQYRAWSYDSDVSEDHPLNPQNNHWFHADLLFDVYFNSNSRWHSYFTTGPGFIVWTAPETKLIPIPWLTLGVGTHYALTNRINLDLEIKVKTMLLFETTVEPTVGISVNY